MNNLQLEMIFDYTCPYCYRAYQFMKDIRTQFPDIEIIFTPCEAHPRPEEWSTHGDLEVMGMHYCLERGIDVWKYSDLVYHALYVDKIDAKNLDQLSASLGELVDPADFKAVIESGTYEEQRLAANQYAWGTLSLPAVPSYQMGGQVLEAIGGVGVSKEALVDFIKAQM